jgi:hypothetical protein
MVKLPRSASIVLGGLAVVTGCQAIIGIDDKQLDPKLTGSDSGPDVEASVEVPLGPLPPDRPSGPTVPSGKGATRWFAARRIYLGTVDPLTKQKDSEAWKRMGHDIDGECTTTVISSSDTSATCSKPPDAAQESLVDGDDCRDNALGRIMSVGLAQLSTDFELQQHTREENAETGTYLLRLDDLDDGPNDPYVRGALYVTVPRDPTLTSPPLWDGSDRFTVDVATVNIPPPPDGGTGDAGALDASVDADISDSATDAEAGSPPPPSPYIDDPLYVFDEGYLVDDVWVSGDFRKSPKILPLFVLGQITEIDSSTVTLVTKLTPAHDRVVGSMLSAAVTTPEIQDKFGPIALELALCIQAGADYLVNNFVLPARDLGNNPPTFQTQGVPCYSLSIGWAFDWEPVKPPQYVAPGKYKAPTCGN